MMQSHSSAVSELQHYLTIPPPSLNGVHLGNSMAIAHAALQTLRETGDERHLFLRSTLEIAQQQVRVDQEELLFHCITGCRQVTITRWKQHTQHYLTELRAFFMLLGHHLRNSRTCRLACYTTAAAFWKRGWNELVHNNDQMFSTPSTIDELSLLEAIKAFISPPNLLTRADLFQYMESRLSLGEVQHVALFFSCLMGEFSGRSAVSYSTPLEFHRDCHRSFEKEGALYETLKLSLLAFQRVASFMVDPPNASLANEAHDVVQLIADVVGWEFGISAWAAGSLGASKTSQTIIRPPMEWREFLAGPDLTHAVLHFHRRVAFDYHGLGHALRQLLILLASLAGPIFSHEGNERQSYAAIMLEGALDLVKFSSQPIKDDSCLLDTLQLISRVVGNFRLSTLVSLPSLLPLLQHLTAIGNNLLKEQVQDYENAGGDVECMELREWREEALSLVLEGAVLLCGDPWLLYSGSEATRRDAQRSLATVLGPLYTGFVTSRIRIAALEENFHVTRQCQFDEAREEITEVDLEEELASIANIGRLDLQSALACISELFSFILPQLEMLWRGGGEITPEISCLLEQARLLNLHTTHLLTDNNEGESPSVPTAIILACKSDEVLPATIASSVWAILNFADAQVRKIAENPDNLRLSPLLACSFLVFLTRWAPAYVYPVENVSSRGANAHIQEWTNPLNAQNVISMCMSLCLHYTSYWPLERQVQTHVQQFLISLARRGPTVRNFIVSSPAFQQMVQFHCLTACMDHSKSRQDFESMIRSLACNVAISTISMIWSFQRLPYRDRSEILAAILIACSDKDNHIASTMINDSLHAVHQAFIKFVEAISSGSIAPGAIDAQETACLCIELLRGITHASEMAEAIRIPDLLTNYLPQVSFLMHHFSDNQTVCELLLLFFCDYTERFIAVINRDQSLALFNSSAELIRVYSASHCSSRTIATRTEAEAKAEEEQSYSDILCLIQLLINLGSKDFIDACSSQQGVDSVQVTDMIFFGLQQILPLMTQGLLQFPSLCSLFFELVGFMMDTYPEKVSRLSFELFKSLLDALLFGMSHHDVDVAKSSLFGIASIAREHLTSHSLKAHLDIHPDIFDVCTRRLLMDVVFQTVVTDRVEASGMALLSLAAVDVLRFARLTQELVGQLPDIHQQSRLRAAFDKLVQVEALQKVSMGGHEGRMNRARFKNDFECFVNEIQSFLVMR